ncbi:MAG TPA: ATP-binding protein, partial [Acidimicrobiales bacterium]|nr:ATP-binding protein [Acidimicrobiales bacterium]
MDARGAWRCALALPCEPETPAVARGFVVGHLRRHELVPLIEDVRLVTSELVTNAVTHAGTEVTVSIEQNAAVVTLTVQDGSSLVPRMSPDDLWAPSGRGLMLVAALSSDWGVLTGSAGFKSVWASFL